jgi:hypothetical protein
MKTLNPANPTNSGGYSQAQVDALIAAAKPKFDLLWENSSPTSNFEAQTVELDLSGYDFVGIRFLTRTNYTGKSQLQIIKVGDFTNVELPPEADNANFTAWRRRTVTVDTTGITFGVGIWLDYSGSKDTGANWIIPIEIYGIKF